MLFLETIGMEQNKTQEMLSVGIETKGFPLGSSLPFYSACQEGNDSSNLRKCHGWDKRDLFGRAALHQGLSSQPGSAAWVLAEGTGGFCYVNSPELNAVLLHSLFWRNKLKVLS